MPPKTGPGDMLGTRQAGMPEFRLADLIRDEAILRTARAAAFQLIREDPLLKNREHWAIKHRLSQFYATSTSGKLN